MPFTVAQISDFHLTTGGPQGTPSERSLEVVVEAVLHQHPDLVVVTGDVSGDRSKESYEVVEHVLTTAFPNLIVTAGNSDDQGALARTFEAAYVPALRVDMGDGWAVATLNSAVEGRSEGALREEQLSELSRSLAVTSKRCVVFLHHNPVDIGSAWASTEHFRRVDSFNTIVGGEQCVSYVAFGHVHQEFRKQLGHTIYCSTPSTHVQAIPEQHDFLVDERAPGFRVFEWDDRGRVTDRVCRTR